MAVIFLTVMSLMNKFDQNLRIFLVDDSSISKLAKHCCCASAIAAYK